jgi:hypothetical protein
MALLTVTVPVLMNESLMVKAVPDPAESVSCPAL